MECEARRVLGPGYLIKADYGPGLTDVTVVLAPARWRRLVETIREGDFETWRYNRARDLRDAIDPRLDDAENVRNPRVWMLLRWA